MHAPLEFVVPYIRTHLVEIVADGVERGVSNDEGVHIGREVLEGGDQNILALFSVDAPDEGHHDLDRLAVAHDAERDLVAGVRGAEDLTELTGALDVRPAPLDDPVAALQAGADELEDTLEGLTPGVAAE